MRNSIKSKYSNNTAYNPPLSLQILDIPHSPRFRHEGGGWFSQEGGMGFFKGCLTNLVFIAIGALIGFIIGTFY